LPWSSSKGGGGIGHWLALARGCMIKQMQPALNGFRPIGCPPSRIIRPHQLGRDPLSALIYSNSASDHGVLSSRQAATPSPAISISSGDTGPSQPAGTPSPVHISPPLHATPRASKYGRLPQGATRTHRTPRFLLASSLLMPMVPNQPIDTHPTGHLSPNHSMQHHNSVAPPFSVGPFYSVGYQHLGPCSLDHHPI
jgi:hypothetical protein